MKKNVCFAVLAVILLTACAPGASSSGSAYSFAKAEGEGYSSDYFATADTAYTNPLKRTDGFLDPYKDYLTESERAKWDALDPTTAREEMKKTVSDHVDWITYFENASSDYTIFADNSASICHVFFFDIQIKDGIQQARCFKIQKVIESTFMVRPIRSNGVYSYAIVPWVDAHESVTLVPRAALANAIKNEASFPYTVYQDDYHFFLMSKDPAFDKAYLTSFNAERSMKLLKA